jgi:hypothetical protein
MHTKIYNLIVIKRNLVPPFMNFNQLLVTFAIISIILYFFGVKHTVFTPFLILVIIFLSYNMVKKHKQVSYTLLLIFMKKYMYQISQSHGISITNFHPFPKRHTAPKQSFQG